MLLGQIKTVAISIVEKAKVRKGLLAVPTGPGLGLEIDPGFLKQNLVDGEGYWA